MGPGFTDGIARTIAVWIVALVAVAVVLGYLMGRLL